MNVIVSNKKKDVFSNLDVDILKTISGEFSVDEIIQTFSNFFFNRMFLDITAIKNYQDVKTIQKLSIGLDVSKIILLLDDTASVNSDSYKSKLVSMGIYNFASDFTGIKYLYDHPNSYKDVAHYQEISPNNNNVSDEVITNVISQKKEVKIIGFKNITEHAGATSLIYMLKKELSNRYNVVALEIDKKSFIYFNDEDMISISSGNLGNTILKFKDKDIILVDLNEFNVSNFNGDVYYLIEPSTIKLNKMMFVNKNVLSKLTHQKVILNMSLLNSSDVRDFEKESGCKVFYNLGPMNDKADNSNVLLPFLERLQLVKRVETNDSNKSNKLFGFLKF